MSEWSSIHDTLGRAKDTRNRIAHGQIEMPGRQRKGRWVHQARLTASPWDVGRRWKEHKPRQWPGMSTHDVRATADRFFWLAVRIEGMREYWQAQSIGPREALPDIFARIVDRRQNSGPLSSDLTPPKP